VFVYTATVKYLDSRQCDEMQWTHCRWPVTVTEFVPQNNHTVKPLDYWGMFISKFNVSHNCYFFIFFYILFRHHNHQNLQLKYSLQTWNNSFILTIPHSNESMTQMLDNMEIKTFDCDNMLLNFTSIWFWCMYCVSLKKCHCQCQVSRQYDVMQ